MLGTEETVRRVQEALDAYRRGPSVILRAEPGFVASECAHCGHAINRAAIRHVEEELLKLDKRGGFGPADIGREFCWLFPTPRECPRPSMVLDYKASGGAERKVTWLWLAQRAERSGGAELVVPVTPAEFRSLGADLSLRPTSDEIASGELIRNADGWRIRLKEFV